MDDRQARDLIAEVLADIAPEIDLAMVDADAPLQDEVDLDSISFLDLVTGLAEGTGLEIPERDYAELATLGGMVRYLSTNT
jgi:acyl carrier protein